MKTFSTSYIALAALISMCVQVQGDSSASLQRRHIDFESNLSEETSAGGSLMRRDEPAPATAPAEPAKEGQATDKKEEAKDPIEDTPAGKLARQLYDLMTDLGTTLESLTSLGAQESEILAGAEKGLNKLPQGESIRKEMMAGVDLQGKVGEELKKATESTERMIKALTEIKSAPKDIMIIKKNYEILEEGYRVIFEMSDQLAAEAFAAAKKNGAAPPATPAQPEPAAQPAPAAEPQPAPAAEPQPAPAAEPQPAPAAEPQPAPAAEPQPAPAAEPQPAPAESEPAKTD